MRGAVPVVLSAGERKTLSKRVRGQRPLTGTGCARGSCWRRRAAGTMHGLLRTCRSPWTPWVSGGAGSPSGGLAGLADLPRCGRPRRISELTRAAVVALACQLPAATGVPLSRWTGPELLAEVTRAGAGGQLSVSPVLRILAEHPVKPWQYQSWICPRDPDFAVKATVILDLYQGFYQGRRLRPGDRILSVDAKPPIQARGRCRPTAPAASLEELASPLLAFVDRYNQGARPFNWKFAAADLARLLDRISAHEHAAEEPAELPEAA